MCGCRISATRSSASLISPSISINAFPVSNTNRFARRTPFFAEKSAAAQSIPIWRSQAGLATRMFATLRPATSISFPLTLPSTISNFTEPSKESVGAAIELPLPLSLMLPLTSPRLVDRPSIFSNRRCNCSLRASSATVPLDGFAFAPMRSEATTAPPAIAKRRGSSVNTALRITIRVSTSRIGSSLSRITRLPMKCTSASIACQRSTLNGSLGSTRPHGCVGLSPAPITRRRP